MRLHIVRFEPSGKAGVFTLEVPAGGIAVAARRTRVGDGNLVLAMPDAPTTETEQVELLSLWEDSVRGQGGGSPAGWRHLGCWSFDSGDFQHLFVREQAAAVAEQPAPASKRRSKPAPADALPPADEPAG